MPTSPRRAAVPEYAIDGRRTTTPDAFYAEVARVLAGAGEWAAGAQGLRDFHELLRGGFGGAPVRCRLVWRDAGLARAALDHDAQARELAARLRDCAPNVLIKTAWALRAALRGEGPTAFDALVVAVREHPGVELVLEGAEGAP